MSDKLCRDNGLSVVVPQKGSKGKSYAEYQAEKTGTSWKEVLDAYHDAVGKTEPPKAKEAEPKKTKGKAKKKSSDLEL